MADSTSSGERVWAEGIAIFAGTVLATLGVLQFLEGLSAVAEDDVLVRRADYVFDVDVSTWGWIHMLIGVLAMVIGVCLLMGQYWALVAGICVAVLSVLANFTFLPYYPLWALVLTAFDILVIWALTVLLGQRS